MDVTKPYEFIGFGAMDVTKPYEFIGFETIASGSHPKTRRLPRKGPPTGARGPKARTSPTHAGRIGANRGLIGA